MTQTASFKTSYDLRDAAAIRVNLTKCPSFGAYVKGLIRKDLASAIPYPLQTENLSLKDQDTLDRILLREMTKASNAA